MSSKPIVNAHHSSSFVYSHKHISTTLKFQLITDHHHKLSLKWFKNRFTPTSSKHISQHNWNHMFVSLAHRERLLRRKRSALEGNMRRKITKKFPWNTQKLFQMNLLFIQNSLFRGQLQYFRPKVRRLSVKHCVSGRIGFV